MENNEIGFNKGIHLSPSLGSEGELTECVNLTPDDGGLKVVPKPKELGVSSEDGKLMCIHTIPGTGEKHYIFAIQSGEYDPTKPVVESGYSESIDISTESTTPPSADSGGGGDEQPESEWKAVLVESKPTSYADKTIYVWMKTEEVQLGTEKFPKTTIYAERAAGQSPEVSISVTYDLYDENDKLWLNGAKKIITIGANESEATSESTGLHYKNLREINIDSVSTDLGWAFSAPAMRLPVYSLECVYGKEKSIVGRFKEMPTSVRAIGNTLIVTTESGVEYVLWKEKKYISLGNKPEEAKILFSLSGETVIMDLDASKDRTTNKVWLTEIVKDADGQYKWCDPIQASNEKIEVGGKVVVFKHAYEFPDKPNSADFIPRGWTDSVVKKVSGGGYYYMVGTVKEGGDVNWGPVKPISEHKYEQGTGNYVYAALYTSPSKPTIPAGEASNSDKRPTGWSKYVWTERKDSAIELLLSEGNSNNYDYYKSNFEALDVGGVGSIVIREEDRENLSQAVMGYVAKWVSDAEKENSFCYPFIVRYAYRMFDGRHIMHSSPILMIPNSMGMPYVSIADMTYHENGAKIRMSLYVGGPCTKLEINKMKIPSSIADWRDIITGVDVFVTQQFYNYNPAGTIRSISRYSDTVRNAYTVSSLSNVVSTLVGDQKQWPYRKTYVASGNALKGTSLKNVSWTADLPSLDVYDEKDNSMSESERRMYESQIEGESRFYLFKSFGIDGLGDGNAETIKCGVIEADSGRLKSIATQEVMDDDYYSHDTLIAKSSFVYNNRLNLAGLKREVFRGYAPNYTQAYRQYVDTDETGVDGNDWVLTSIKIHIKTGDGGDIVVETYNEPWVYGTVKKGKPYIPEYLFYPNPNAYKATLCFSPLVERVTKMYMEYQVKMTEHKGLNGAYWFRGLLMAKDLGERSFYWQYTYDYEHDVINTEIEKGTQTFVTAKKSIALPHSIYTSNVNNPFYFAAENVNQVGSGEIMTISTTTKALSQGQRGRTPLYAFCSDGIWDLSVADNGQFMTVNPVSRDVCNNIESIVQIDSAVIFATEQGLKLLSGEETINLSEALAESNDLSAEVKSDGETLSMVSWGVGKLQRINGGMYGKLADVLVDEETNFNDAIKECKAVYDYANKLVHFYIPKKKKHYVLSLKNREFSTLVDEKIKSVAADYPESVVQYENGSLATFRARNADETECYPGIVLTRPICFGDAMGMKTLFDLRMMYRRTSEDSKCYICKFVSNDRLHWVPLHSMRSHGYKWYRFVILTNLANADALEGMVCQTMTRRNGKLR